jgi:hypothetical protein
MAFPKSRRIVLSKTNLSGGRNAMNEFIAKYWQEISGTLTGFDRLVFRGSLRSIA